MTWNHGPWFDIQDRVVDTIKILSTSLQSWYCINIVRLVKKGIEHSDLILALYCHIGIHDSLVNTLIPVYPKNKISFEIGSNAWHVDQLVCTILNSHNCLPTVTIGIHHMLILNNKIHDYILVLLNILSTACWIRCCGSSLAIQLWEEKCEDLTC